MKSIQEIYAPNLMCFGCGPKNKQGLQIKSVVEENAFIAYFQPEAHHQAFDNVLSGGIVGTLLDCHSNWCAAYSIMSKLDSDTPPCTVTARYAVELLAPTPMDQRLKIIATPIEVSHKKALIKAEILAGSICTAKCEGMFVAVKEGHPAYHRW